MLNKNLLTGRCYRDGVEITPEAYAAALAENRQKAAYVNEVYKGAIPLEEVPESWREDVQRQVENRKAAAQVEPDLTADEALSILLGGETA